MKKFLINALCVIVYVVGSLALGAVFALAF